MVAGALVMLIPVIGFDKNDNIIGERFFIISCVIGVLVFLSALLLTRLVTERADGQMCEEKVSYLKVLKGCAQSRSFVGLSIATIANLILLMSTFTTNSLVFQCYFHSTKLLPLVSIASYIPMAIGVLVIGKPSARFGKRNIVCLTLLVSVASCLGMLLFPASQNGAILWVIYLMFVNVGEGFFTLIVWAMLADCIDEQQKKTGGHDEGSIYAVYSMIRFSQRSPQAILRIAAVIWRVAKH